MKMMQCDSVKILCAKCRERANKLANAIVVVVVFVERRRRTLFTLFKIEYGPNHWLIFNRFTFQCGAFCLLFRSFTHSHTFYLAPSPLSFLHFLSPFLPLSHPFQSTMCVNSDDEAQQRLSTKRYFQLDTYFKSIHTNAHAN